MRPQEVVIVGKTGGFPFWRVALLAAGLAFVVAQAGGWFGAAAPESPPATIDSALIGDIQEQGSTSASACADYVLQCFLWTGESGPYAKGWAKFGVQLAGSSNIRFGWRCESGWRAQTAISNSSGSPSAWYQVAYENTPILFPANEHCAFQVYAVSINNAPAGSFRIQAVTLKFENSDALPGDDGASDWPDTSSWDPNNPPNGWCYDVGLNGQPGRWYQAAQCAEAGDEPIADLSCTDGAGNSINNNCHSASTAPLVNGGVYTFESTITAGPGGSSGCEMKLTDSTANFDGYSVRAHWSSMSAGQTLTQTQTNVTWSLSSGARYMAVGCGDGQGGGYGRLVITQTGGTGYEPPPDGAVDSDGDGFTDHYEDLEGTDPNDPASRPDTNTPPPPPGSGTAIGGDGMAEFCEDNPTAGACDTGNDFTEFCNANPGKAACRDGNPFGEFCTANPNSGACDEDNPIFEWCTGGGAETALCNPADTEGIQCGGPGCTGSTGDGDIGRGLGSGGGMGDTAWTDGACVDLNPKVGTLTLLTIEPASAPDEALNLIGWLAYIAGTMYYAFGWFLNALGSLWNVVVDLVVPSACFLESMTAFVGYLGEQFPFSVITGLLGIVDNGVSQPSFDWSVSVAGQTVTVPLGWAAGAVAPLRPLLVSAVWAGFAWNTLGWLFSIVGPDPRRKEPVSGERTF